MSTGATSADPGGARVARLGTVDAEGRPHLVPCCFALVADVAYSVVDHKPKTTTALRRLDNIRARPAACLLIDHYDDADWSALWWARLDGTARILESGDEWANAIALLCAKYPQYAADRPSGAVIALDITTRRTWSAAG